MPVDARHIDYRTAQAGWQRCRDAFNGSEAIKSAGETYLPRLADQDEGMYAAYLERALYYNATARTIAGLSGCVFRKPIEIRVPDTVSPMLDDVTLTGVSFEEFCAEAFKEKLLLNRYGVLVEFTEPDAEQAGVVVGNVEGEQRPYLVSYRAEQIINWATERVGGRTVLSMVTLMERWPERNIEDPFLVEYVDQYRVLTLEGGQYVARVYRENDTKNGTSSDYVLISEYRPNLRGQSLDFIPFYFLGGTHVVEKPPMLDLVEVNLSHYRTSADLEHGRHYTALPTPWVAGFPAKSTLKIGSGVAWVAPDANARAGMLEFTGQGLQALEKALEEKESKMAALGAQLLRERKLVAETAESIALQQAGEQSVLQAIVQAVNRTLTKAMQTFCLWAGTSDEAVEISLNTEFVESRMSPQELHELTLTWQAGGISNETYYFNLQRGDLTRPGVEWEEEKQLIDAGAPEPKQTFIVNPNPDQNPFETGGQNDGGGQE